MIGYGQIVRIYTMKDLIILLWVLFVWFMTGVLMAILMWLDFMPLNIIISIVFLIWFVRYAGPVW